MSLHRRPLTLPHRSGLRQTACGRHASQQETNQAVPGASTAHGNLQRRPEQAHRPRVPHFALGVTALVLGALACDVSTPPPPPAAGAPQERQNRLDPTLTADFEKRLRDALRSDSPKVDIEGYDVRPSLTLPMGVETLNETLWWDPSSGGIRYALEGDAARSFIRAMTAYRYEEHDSCGTELRITIWDKDCQLLVLYVGQGWNGIYWRGQCLGVQGGTANVMLEAALAAFRSAVPGGPKLQRECFELDYGYGHLSRAEK
jgi:hypothetical protein